MKEKLYMKLIWIALMVAWLNGCSALRGVSNAFKRGIHITLPGLK